MFTWGKASIANRKGVHPILLKVIDLALEISPVDMKLICGVRTPEEQAELYAQGRTKPGPKVTWTLKSNHFINPKTGYGHAVDLFPAPYDWNDLEAFNKMAEAMFAAAKILGVTIRWGADWDMDGNPRERGEVDSPHFELVL